MNPVLPLQVFVPDPEARHGADGRTYVYGSLDLSGSSSYCSREYRVFSSADLVAWRDHGRSFTTEDDALGEPWRDATLYAPDCVYAHGRYHLFFCTAANGEGVATAELPSGPFSSPVPVAGAHGDAIDPAAFIDDDGKAYLFWGQFHARGARLRDDLRSIDATTLHRSLITEEEHGFHEGLSIRKHNGVYYLVYADISRGRPTSLGYATASAPLGPYEKRGIIIDNTGCDPHTWNNHGSIEKVNGSWYVFYHRASQGSRFNRRMCIEPIQILADGTIPEVPMTTSGVEGPLDPCRFIDASRACSLAGGLYAAPVRCPESADDSLPANADGYHEVLMNITDGSAAGYRFFAFSGQTRFHCVASSGTYGGRIEIRLDDLEGEVIGECEVEGTGAWGRFTRSSCEVRPVDGTHAVWLIFRRGRGQPDGRLLDVRGFRFGR